MYRTYCTSIFTGPTPIIHPLSQEAIIEILVDTGDKHLKGVNILEEYFHFGV